MSDPTATTIAHPRLSGLNPEALMAQAVPGVGPESIEVPGFVLEAMIGRGGMGVVFLARQVRLDREVAVKVLASELAGDPLFLERIEREARTMARLRHPNIVTVHDFLMLEDGSAAIVMEFIEGGSLRDTLREHPNGLPVAEALRIIGQIAAGLETAHASGVIHRDMKPENVLMGNDGTARVTDFGLALPLHEPTARLTLTGTTVGTVDYMAPEQLKGGELDTRLDIFALGVIAYELLTGQTPRGSFDAPHLVRPEVPVPVSAAVMRALRPDPAARFATVEGFVLALHGTGVTEKRTLPVGRFVGAIVLMLLMAALAGAAWSFFKRAKVEQEEVGAVAASSPPVPAVVAKTAPDVPAPMVPQMIQAVAGPWTDAIAGAHIHNDNFGGDWTRDGGVLTSNDAVCILSLEKELPEHYEVRMKFTRLSGEHSVTLFFRSDWSVGSAELDAWDEGLAGVQMISGASLQDGYGFRFPLENGRSYELLVEVRPGLVRMSVDGVFQKEFDIVGKFLSPPSPWNWDPIDRPTALAIGSYRSPTRFEKVEWREMGIVKGQTGGGR